MDYQKAGINFKGKSWCQNIKLLSDDGKIKYSKRAGFQTSEEELQSAVSYEERFKEDLRKFHLKNKIDFDITLKDYLIYWYNEIYSSRVEATARMLGQYTLYYLIFPQLEKKIKLRYANTEYFNALLKRVAGICPSAGNKGREVLNIAMRDAFGNGALSKTQAGDKNFIQATNKNTAAGS